MSEAAQNTQPLPRNTLSQKPELVVLPGAYEANFEITHRPFDKASYLNYLDHATKTSGPDALIRLLEQLGTIPDEIENTADAQFERQHKIERIAVAKQYFEEFYTDPTSTIGKNKARLIELFDKTDVFESSVILSAFSSLLPEVKDKSYKPAVNEAEYLYRIILADEHGITLELP